MKVKLELEFETIKDFDLDVIGKIVRRAREELEPYGFVDGKFTLTLLDRVFKEVKAE